MTPAASDAGTSSVGEGAAVPAVGARVGRYVILGTLARGGMGEVLRARAFGAAGATKDVCIKRIRSTRLADRQAVARFIDEARLSLALTHANIVSTFDFGRAENDYYLAMEWIDGADLARLASAAVDRPLSPAVVAHVGAEVARALQHAHEGTPQRPGIVHCDVKPSNVLVSRSGDVKLADFGVAVARLDGMRGGTPRYMPPEQRAGAEVGPAVDLYALGVVLDELLDRATHRPPALNALVNQLAQADPAARPTALDVVSTLERFVARARIDGEPAPRDDLGARAALAAPVIDATPSMLVAESSYLRDGESETETRLTATTSSRSTPPPPAKTRSTLLIGAAIAVGVAVMLAYAPSRRAPDPEPTRADSDERGEEAMSVQVSAPPPRDESTASSPGPRPSTSDETSARASFEPSAPLAPATAPPVAPDAARRAPPRPRRTETEDGPPTAAEAPVRVEAAGAHLRINAIPWATVELDGRPIGTTPLTRVEAGSGEHVLRFTNDVLGVERTEHVELAPNEHRDVIVDLR